MDGESRRSKNSMKALTIDVKKRGGNENDATIINN